eukprot:c20341_g1_i1.p1 GENE.c20341_g1_i1~~c20341_g1_i1.p1  ORF type:complete len:180 (+),score=46.44 c20341_g1_i1:16-555(+)
MGVYNCIALFILEFVCCLLFGVIALALYFSIVAPMESAQGFLETSCIVLKTNIDINIFMNEYRCEISVTYMDSLNRNHTATAFNYLNHKYSKQRSTASNYCDKFTVGNSYTCFYNPNDYDEVTMDRLWNESAYVAMWCFVSFCSCAGCVFLCTCLCVQCSSETPRARVKPAPFQGEPAD